MQWYRVTFFLYLEILFTLFKYFLSHLPMLSLFSTPAVSTLFYKLLGQEFLVWTEFDFLSQIFPLTRKNFCLSITRKSKIIIERFGQSNYIPEEINVVSLQIKFLNHSFITTVEICKPMITTNLAKQNILFVIEKYIYLQNTNNC